LAERHAWGATGLGMPAAFDMETKIISWNHNFSAPGHFLLRAALKFVLWNTHLVVQIKQQIVCRLEHAPSRTISSSVEPPLVHVDKTKKSVFSEQNDLGFWIAWLMSQKKMYHSSRLVR
jgi:hypothetical protein